MDNTIYKQISGPFKANVDIDLRNEYSIPVKIGIKGYPFHKVKINRETTMIIGKDKMLEIENTKIHTISFLSDEPADTYIDLYWK